MKKVICLVLGILMVLSFAACSGTPVSTDASTAGTTASATEAATTAEETTAAATTSQDEPIVVEEEDTDYEWVNVGSYLRVLVKPSIVTLTSEVVQGLGSKETVTLTVSLADGFVFDGWTEKNTIANLARGKDAYEVTKTETIVIDASEDIVPSGATDGRLNVIPNYSYTVTYHPNGGTVKDGGDTYNQSYSAVIYKCVSTLPEQGYFAREGYTLVEYNTKADGTGYAVSLGSRMPMGGKPTTDLYCIWAKQNDASEFTYKVSGSSVTITGFTGTSEVLVIPDTIEGKKVTTISNTFDTSAAVTEVILSKNVTTVQNGAFLGLDKLETLVMFDGITDISDGCFDSEVFSNLRVNAVLNLFSNWQQVQTTIKLDRLVEASYLGQKMFVIYGGSGALNGIDGSQIDEATNGEYVVINLGSNAQCTAAYYFDWLDDVTKEGDVVLWMPEAGNYMLGDAQFHNRLWEINSGDYDILRYIDISNYSGVFDTFSGYASSHAGYQAAWDIVNIGMDCYGDPTGTRVHNASKNYDNSYNFSVSVAGYTYMKELVADLSEKGVVLFWTYPAVDQDSSGISQKVLEKYRDTVLHVFSQFTCISSWETPLVPYEYMYDSEWHLTNEGAKYRTQKLAEDIKNALNK